MATNSVSNMINSKLRMSGLSSGLDTESIIKSILASDKAKIDKAKQQKQIQLWKQESYRDTTNMLRTFKDENFDVLKPSTNFKSTSAFSSFNTSYTTGTADSVSVTGTSDAVTGDHTINVLQLASQASISTSSITKEISGSISLSTFPLDLTGKTLSLTLDGTTKSLTLGNYNNLTDLQSGLQSAINTNFGAGRIILSLSGAGLDKLSFTAGTGSSLSLTAADDVFTSLGFSATDSKSNRISLTSSLSSISSFFKTGLTIADTGADVSFTVNGKIVSLGKNYTQASIGDVISAVNKSDAGVFLKYSTLTDSFSLTNKEYGAVNDLTVADNSDKLLESLGIVGGGATKHTATDSVMNIDGVNGVTRNNNTFTIEGIVYSLKKTGTVDFTLEKNVTDLVEKIKNFVTKYNDMLDKVSTKSAEKYDRTYLPLTDDEKTAMSEDDIKNWETKAKTGLLYNDSMLNSVSTAMRRAMLEPISGLGLTLRDIGIVSNSYQDKGKLTIDETKLNSALSNNYQDVVKLFTNESSTTYATALTDTTAKATRFSESGLSQRIYDVLQDNIRTTSGKGELLKKAGMPGDTTDFLNFISSDIINKDKNINTLTDRMNTKSDNLYKKYAALETAMSKMNAQSSWLQQQSGSNG